MTANACCRYLKNISGIVGLSGRAVAIGLSSCMRAAALLSLLTAGGTDNKCSHTTYCPTLHACASTSPKAEAHSKSVLRERTA